MKRPDYSETADFTVGNALSGSGPACERMVAERESRRTLDTRLGPAVSSIELDGQLTRRRIKHTKPARQECSIEEAPFPFWRPWGLARPFFSARWRRRR